LTSKKPDWKEGLYFGGETEKDQPDYEKPMHGKNLWPANMPEMEGIVMEYMHDLTDLGHLIMKLIALAMGLDHDFFREVSSGKDGIDFTEIHIDTVYPFPIILLSRRRGWLS
jgi:isopenicillin N synthase-like dioxygenase